MSKLLTRIQRKKHIRKTVSGTDARPRLTVYRSNKHIYAQIINDTNAVTIVSASDMKVNNGAKVDSAKQVGEDIAKLAVSKKVTKVVFDRNGYKFHGRVKALAEAARANGLEF